MTLLYKRGKNYRILKNCWYHKTYETYHRELSGRYSGNETLDERKIIGEINKNGKLEPHLHEHWGKTPEKVVEIAKNMGLEIEKDSCIGGEKSYYYQGKYRKYSELFIC